MVARRLTGDLLGSLRVPYFFQGPSSGVYQSGLNWREYQYFLTRLRMSTSGDEEGVASEENDPENLSAHLDLDLLPYVGFEVAENSGTTLLEKGDIIIGVGEHESMVENCLVCGGKRAKDSVAEVIPSFGLPARGRDVAAARSSAHNNSNRMQDIDEDEEMEFSENGSKRRKTNDTEHTELSTTCQHDDYVDFTILSGEQMEELDLDLKQNLVLHVIRNGYLYDANNIIGDEAAVISTMPPFMAQMQGQTIQTSATSSNPNAQPGANVDMEIVSEDKSPSKTDQKLQIHSKDQRRRRVPQSEKDKAEKEKTDWSRENRKQIDAEQFAIMKRQHYPNCEKIFAQDFNNTEMFAANKRTIQFEYLSHTADIIFHAWGTSLKQSFERVGVCMFSYLSELYSVECTEIVEIEVKNAKNPKDLLFHYLDELLFMFITEMFMVKYLEIVEFPDEKQLMTHSCNNEAIRPFVPSCEDTDDETDTPVLHGNVAGVSNSPNSGPKKSTAGNFGLKVRCYGEPFQPRVKHPQGTEIKAITMHEMRLNVENVKIETVNCANAPKTIDGDDRDMSKLTEVYVLVDI